MRMFRSGTQTRLARKDNVLQKNITPAGTRIPMLICAILFVLITIPTFFDIYRSAAFHDTPIDDYFSYLRWMVRHGGSPPNAPFVYRPLAVVVAVPLYYILPLYRFTLLPDMDLTQLRAIEAVSMSWYAGMLLTSWLTYLIATRRLGVRPVSALLLAAVAFGLLGHCGGIDSVVIATIALILYNIERPLIYAPLMIISAGIDEKIPIIFFAFWSVRLVEVLIRRDGQARVVVKWILPTLAALFVYAGFRMVVRAGGSEQQTDPTRWIGDVISTAQATFSAKGIVLNGVPLLIMVALVVLSWLGSRDQSGVRWAWRRFPWDISCFAAITFAACLADVRYNVGRIILHTFPMYLPQAGRLLDAYLLPRFEIRKTDDSQLRVLETV